MGLSRFILDVFNIKNYPRIHKVVWFIITDILIIGTFLPIV